MKFLQFILMTKDTECYDCCKNWRSCDDPGMRGRAKGVWVARRRWYRLLWWGWYLLGLPQLLLLLPAWPFTLHCLKCSFARGWIPEDILAKYQRALFFFSYLLMASLRHLIWQSRSRSLTLCAHKKTKVYCSRQLAQQCCCAWDTQFYPVQTDLVWRMCTLQFCFTTELFVFGTCSLTLPNKRPQKETQKVLSD